MKALRLIKEKTCGVLMWIPFLLVLPVGFLITARQAGRYIRNSRM